MFLINKYRDDAILPSFNIINKLLNSLNTHNMIYNNIDNVVKQPQKDFYNIIDKLEHGHWNYANLPHLLFYGPEGCGKEFLIEMLLEKIFTKKSVMVQETEYTINGYSNVKTKVMIKQSKHHIVIEPNNNGFDKYLIHEIIEDYAQSEILQVLRYKHLYKIVIINLIDNLSYYAQASLRRTMEKYANTCKFIFISNQLSKVHEPLKSRCMMIRVPAPTDMMIMSIIMNISYKEKIKLTGDNIKKIVQQSKNNINIAIGMLELLLYNVPYDISWHNIIDNICELINDKSQYNKKGISNIVEDIRGLLYQLYITNISFNIIIKEIMNKMIMNINDMNIKYKIIDVTSKYENRIALGTRHIVHLEAYIIKLIQIIANIPSTLPISNTNGLNGP
jgi:replication factor C subunit 3/5